MLYDRLEWLLRMKEVEKEHTASKIAMDRFRSQAELDPTVLRGVGFPDIGRASENLEGTYVIRLFAEFEAALRTYWSTYKLKKPPGRAIVLIDRVASTARIDPISHEAAHVVRRFRNVLVHNREEPTKSVAIADVRRSLNKYLDYLKPPR